MIKSSKKSTFIAAALLSAAVAVPMLGQTHVAYAQTVSINGQAMRSGVQPIKRNGRTLVAMRPIFEGLGASVQWDAAKHSITAKSGGVSVLMTIGSPYAIVDGKVVKLDQAPMLYRGNTMVPLRFVSETMGASVNYNANTQGISINTDGNSASSQAAITLKTDKQVYLPQEPIKLAFTAPVQNEHIRIKLVSSDIPAGDPKANTDNQLAADALWDKKQGVLNFKAPEKLGTYEFRSQGETTQFSSTSFEVVAKTGDAQRQVRVDKTHYKLKEKIVFHFNAVIFQNERISLVSTDIPSGNAEITHANEILAFATHSRTQGSSDFRGIRKPGTYELRMDDGNGNEVAHSEPFTVSDE